jgi:hypothetical protein
MEPINLEEEVQTAPGIDLTGATTIAPSLEVATSRAQRNSIGLGKSTDELYQEILAGREEQLRDEALATENYQDAMRKQQAIVKFANERKEPLTPEEVASITQRKGPNRNVILEYKYGQEYQKQALADAGVKLEDTILTGADTRHVARATEFGSDLIAKNDKIDRWIEHYTDAEKNQPWLDPMDAQGNRSSGWISDRLKEVLSFGAYEFFRKRGNHQDVSWFAGITQGNNIEAQSRAAYRMPLNEFGTWLDTVMERMKDNPGMALSYAKSLKGMSLEEIISGNMSTVADATIAADVGLTIQAIRQGTASQQAVKGLYAAAQKEKELKRAAESIARQAADPDPNLSPAANMAVGAGNLEEAAALRAADQIVRANAGMLDVTKDGLDMLTSNLRVSSDRIVQNPGALTNQQALKIAEKYQDTENNIVRTIIDTTRPARRPDITQTEEGVRVSIEAMRQQLREENVLDISVPIKDPVSNTHWHRVSIGDPKGGAFSTREAAEGYAIRKGYQPITEELSGPPDLRATWMPKGSKTYYISESAAKHFEGVKVGADGKPFIYIDLANDVTVDYTSRPKAGYVPIKISPDGKAVKFDKTIPPEGTKTWYFHPEDVKNHKSLEIKDGKVTLVMSEAKQSFSTNKPKSNLEDRRKSLYAEREKLKTEEFRGQANARPKQEDGELFNVLGEAVSDLPSAERASDGVARALKLNRPDIAETILDNLDDYVSGFKGKAGADFRKEADAVRAKHNIPRKEATQGVEAPTGKITSKSKIVDRDVAARYNEPIPGYIPVRLLPNGNTEWMPALPENVAQIQQQGLGFIIVGNLKPLKETDSIFKDGFFSGKDGLIEAKSAATRGDVAWTNRLFGKYRNPDDTLAQFDVENRKLAVYGKANFLEMLKEDAKIIEDMMLGKIKNDPVTGEDLGLWRRRMAELNVPAHTFKQQLAQTRQDFLRTLKHNQDTETFFKDPSQLSDFYQRSFGRFPSFAEANAYFAYTRLYDIDLSLRRIALFRNKARLGAEQHRVSFTPTGSNSGEPITSEFFEGVARKEFPGGTDALIYIDNSGQHKVYRLGHSQINPTRLNEWKQLVENGQMRVIEIYDPESTPLSRFTEQGGTRLRYVLTDAGNMESKPLSFMNQLPAKDGGHREYVSNIGIKQAKIHTQTINRNTSQRYEGDQTYSLARSRAEGEEGAAVLNQFGLYMAKGQRTEAKAYLAAIQWPQDYKKMAQLFYPTRDRTTGKINPARFDLTLNEQGDALLNPFTVVDKNQTIFDMSKELQTRIGPNFEDGTRSGSLARQFQVAYTQERDAHEVLSFQNVGTDNNPIYQLPTAEMVDPLTAMSRGLNRVTNSTVMDDYKLHAVESWMREAEGYMKSENSEIRSAPFYYYKIALQDLKPGVNPNRENTNPDAMRMRILEGNKSKIDTFLNAPDTWDTFVANQTNALMEGMYHKWGSPEQRTMFQKALATPIHVLSQIPDPVSKGRALAVHSYLGLFNVKQLWIQMQTATNVFAISPRSMATSTVGDLLHIYAAHMGRDEASLNYLDNIASKIKIPGMRHWRPGEWKEASIEMGRSGFNKVGSEYAMLDETQKTFINNEFGNFLDAGQMFWKTGERRVREVAWFTAFKELRDERPTGPITDRDHATLIARADELTANMSRASSSALTEGIMKTPSQFLSYQIRVTEQFFSKRLDPMDKFRLFAAHSALYGMPIATGFFGFPIGEYIRKWAIEGSLPFQSEGYVPGNDPYMTLFMEGLPAGAIAYITGHGDMTDVRKRMQTGNLYNIGPRYGLQGMTWMREALRGDVAWWSMLGGAAFSKSSGIFLTAMDPFYQFGVSYIRGEEQGFTLKVQDFVDIAKEIATSASDAERMIVAMNTGRWMSKNGSLVESDVSAANAIFMTVFGLSPTAQQDIFLKGWTKKDEMDAQKKGAQQFYKEWRRHILAMKNEDWDNAKDYADRAFSRLYAYGIPKEDWGKHIAIGTQGYESMVESIDKNFYERNVPESRKAARAEAYKSLLRLRNQKDEVLYEGTLNKGN